MYCRGRPDPCQGFVTVRACDGNFSNSQIHQRQINYLYRLRGIVVKNNSLQSLRLFILFYLLFSFVLLFYIFSVFHQAFPHRKQANAVAKTIHCNHCVWWFCFTSCFRLYFYFTCSWFFFRLFPKKQANLPAKAHCSHCVPFFWAYISCCFLFSNHLVFYSLFMLSPPPSPPWPRARS